MISRPENIGEKVDLLGLYKEVALEDMEAARVQTLKALESASGQKVELEIQARQRGRSTRRWLWPAVATVAATVALVVFLPPRVVQSAPAILEDADGKRQIQYGELVRPIGDMSAMLSITDGARVESRSMSEFSLERTDDGGTKIRLNAGGLIVDAASQPGATLVVETKDITARVSGAVSLVRAEEEGSRVAAIDGEVRVQQGATEKTLRSGEQVATNPKMESIPLKEQVAWSFRAEAHVALLQQPQEAFEEASIRPSPPPPAGGRGGPGGRGGGSPSCSGPLVPLRLEIDPHRFAARSANLRSLVMAAYGKGCLLVSGGPDWISSERYDLEAIIPEGSGSYTVAQFRQGDAPKLQRMLQTLLADRFKLRVRPEMKDMEIYNLVVVKEGKLKPADPSRDSSGSSDRPVPTIHGRLNMLTLSEMLARLLSRPVTDKTNLNGLFDVHLEWSVELPAPGAPDGRSRLDESSIFPAIQEQLGLKLEPAKTSMEALVIERAEKPTEN